VRGSQWALALKGMFADRGVVLSAFLVVLLAAALLAAIPIYANAVAQGSLRERLKRASTIEANVQATVDVFYGDVDPSLDPRVERIVRNVFGETTVAIHRSAESEPFTVRGRAAVFGSFRDLDRHARLLVGRWPASRAAPVEVVMPAPVARELRVRVGDSVSARSRADGDKVVTARVVGIYRVERPSSVYWWGQPLAANGVLGPLVTTRRSFFALEPQVAELRWRLEPDLRRLTIGQASRLRRELARLPRRLNAGRPSGQQLLVETNLPQLLSGAARSLVVARAGVLVPSIQLALLAAYGLLITAVLLTERRLLRTESLRLRGATTAQLATIALVEACLITLPAVAVAPWAAGAALLALNVIGPLATVGMRLEPHVSVAAYALAGAAGAVCVAGLVLPVVATRRVAVAGEHRRLPLVGVAQRVRLDVALFLLAILGYWQLRRYHGVLLSNRGSLAIDPFLVAAPAILLLAGALLSLRLLPLAAELLERLLVSTRGAVTALGFWQLARRPRGYMRSVLLLVLAVAIGVFAATYSTTWHQSQIDQAKYSAGADLLVEPSEASGTPPSIALASAYRALGVDEALPVARESFNLDRFGGESGNLLAVDVGRAGAAVHTRADFATRPLGELLRPLFAGRGSLASLPLPGRPMRLALSVRLASVPERRPPAPTPADGSLRRPSASLVLYLRDGEGVLYAYPLGDLAPGRDSRFALDLSGRLPSGRAASPRYPLGLVGLELLHEVPHLVAHRVTLLVHSLDVAPGALGEWSRVPLSAGPRWRASASSFKLVYEPSRVAGVSARGESVRATLSTGSTYTFERPPSIEVLLRPGRDSLRRAAPVLVSESFLEATHAKVGHVLPLALGGATQSVRIVGSYRHFPTLDPVLPSVVVDLPTYVASSFAREGAVVPRSEWWLETARERDVAEQLRAAPYRSLSVVSRSERERALLEDPAPLGVIGALAVGFVIAVAFAVVSFAASATASTRSRMLEFAVLRALGLRTRQLSGWMGLESALVVGLSLLVGTALGLVVARLVLPYVALGASGEAPVPPVRLVVPWATVLLLDLAVLGALVAVAAVQVAYLRRLRPAPILRSGEGVVAP
jgi:FtsX-like permease family